MRRCRASQRYSGKATRMARTPLAQYDELDHDQRAEPDVGGLTPAPLAEQGDRQSSTPDQHREQSRPTRRPGKALGLRAVAAACQVSDKPFHGQIGRATPAGLHRPGVGVPVAGAHPQVDEEADDRQQRQAPARLRCSRIRRSVTRYCDGERADARRYRGCGWRSPGRRRAPASHQRRCRAASQAQLAPARKMPSE